MAWAYKKEACLVVVGILTKKLWLLVTWTFGGFEFQNMNMGLTGWIWIWREWGLCGWLLTTIFKEVVNWGALWWRFHSWWWSVRSWRGPHSETYQWSPAWRDSTGWSRQSRQLDDQSCQTCGAEDGTPEGWGCNQRWWEPPATQTGLSSLTCPCNENTLLFSLSWFPMQFCDIYSRFIQDQRCVHTCQKSWSSFASRPHIARELQILCSKSHQTCLCQTDLKVVWVMNLLKHFMTSYLSCCRWWPCWTLCHCHWPKPFAARQALLSQICSRQLFQSSPSTGSLQACLEGVGRACEAWTWTSWPDIHHQPRIKKVGFSQLSWWASDGEIVCSVSQRLQRRTTSYGGDVNCEFGDALRDC